MLLPWSPVSWFRYNSKTGWHWQSLRNIYLVLWSETYLCISPLSFLMDILNKLIQMESKMPLYADDLIIYLMNPEKSLMTLQKYFQHFGIFSRLKVNYTKSEVYPVYLENHQRSSLEQAFPYKWTNDGWRHLGVYITEKNGRDREI